MSISLLRAIIFFVNPLGKNQKRLNALDSLVWNAKIELINTKISLNKTILRMTMLVSS